MDVTARPAPGREVDTNDFADLTAAPVSCVAWGSEGELVVTFDGDVPEDEADRVRARIESRSPGDEALRVGASDYLRVADPDLAQMRVQVETLTRIVLGK